jgi:predicted aspartyl protease
MTRASLAVALALAMSVLTGAAPTVDAAPPTVAVRRADQPPTAAPARASTFPAPVRFKETDGFGLMVDVWLNGAGPFRFAVDTGAGGTLIADRVARAANVATRESSVQLAGLSGAGDAAAREADDFELAVGTADNRLPSSGSAIVVSTLPPELSGILDPTEAYFPLGFVLDYPGRELRAFDPASSPVRVDAPPANGAVVEWIADDVDRRPFVELADGRRALLDTGSRFGLAIGESDANARGISLTNPTRETIVSDVGGGRVTARRVRPTSIQLGPMMLSNVPTDVLSGVSADAPVILGRDALRPFQLTFDPIARLIGIAPSAR